MTPPRRPTRRRSLVAAALAALTGLALAASLAPSVVAAPAATPSDPLNVDLARPTGAFRGGANGTLYGLSDDGVPSQPVLDGARVTNTSQKPPDGAQHPNGDALDVESSFFAGAGKDIYVYLQDEYPDWAYNGGRRPGDADGDGTWDYVPVIRAAVEKIATKSAHPQRYVFIPFNEPDAGNWYADWSTMKDQFLADWSTAYATIEDVYAAHGLGHARIGGPGDAVWEPARSADFLSYAKAHAQLPDVFIWHELQDASLANFRGHVAQYRRLLASLGLPAIPVNITEYGLLHHMGVPGSLVQWLSMFESEKVDAQTAYWNYAGNIDDNSSRTNGGNAGWWMFKWYGDLAGSQTVRVSPPQLDVPDTLQGLATIDRRDAKATVLFGGGSRDVAVNVSGLGAAAFGSTVHVQVRADRLNGAEGASLEPPVVLAADVPVHAGAISVTVPNADPSTGYQLQVTPALAAPEPVATDLVDTTEAEDAQLSDATVYYQDPANDWSLLASNNHDVGSFNRVGSSATWPVTVPRDGTYRLSILAGANQAPGEHALFVDGEFDQLVKYSADLGWGYRGTTDVTLRLSAGPHVLSLRASRDGTSLLPGADITLDRFDLYDVTDGERAAYPATDARLSAGAFLDYSAPATAGFARLGAATFFTATAATGYYDVTARYATKQAAQLRLDVNGRPVELPRATGAGTWTSRVRLFLAQGINELRISGSGGILLQGITTDRGAAQVAADSDPAAVDRVEAESLPLAGATRVQTIAPSSGSNGSSDAAGAVHVVGYLGNGAGNTMTMDRPPSFGPGQYVLVAGYANAERDSGINYNPQVVTRFLDVTEAGGATTRAPFRHDYSWNSFWDKSVPLTLTTAAGALTFGNPTAYGPDVDTVTLARLVAAAGSTVRTPAG